MNKSTLIKKTIPIEDREYFQPDKGESAPKGVVTYQGEHGGSYYVPDYSYSQIKRLAKNLNSIFNVSPRISEYIWLIERGSLSGKDRELTKKFISNILKENNVYYDSFFYDYEKFHIDIYQMFQKHTGVSFDLRGLSPKVSMRIVDSHIKLNNIFPNIYKRALGSVEASSYEGHVHGVLARSGANIEQEEDEKSTIFYHDLFSQINQSGMSKADERFQTQKMLRKANGESSFIESRGDVDVYEYTTNHEFGHCIQNYLAINGIREDFGSDYEIDEYDFRSYTKKGALNEFLNAMHNHYLGVNGQYSDKFAKKYSRYAASSTYGEFSAELITAAICGSSKYNKDRMINLVRYYLSNLENELSSKA